MGYWTSEVGEVVAAGPLITELNTWVGGYYIGKKCFLPDRCLLRHLYSPPAVIVETKEAISTVLKRL